MDTCSPDAVTSLSGFFFSTRSMPRACSSTPCWTSDTDDSESNIVSALIPPSSPMITAALVLTAATVTTSIFGGPTVDRGAGCPSRAPHCCFPGGCNSWLGVRAGHTQNIEDRVLGGDIGKGSHAGHAPVDCS